MSASGRISIILRSFTLVIGLLSISVSVFEYRIEDRIENELESARNQDDTAGEANAGDDNPLYLPDYEATINSFQLHLINIPNFLGHIPELVIETIWYHIKHPLIELNFFRTLFQHIISPNAP
jgi:hypothetical protein